MATFRRPLLAITLLPFIFIIFCIVLSNLDINYGINISLGTRTNYSGFALSTQSSATRSRDSKTHVDVRSCDYFAGRWVWDGLNYPYYSANECPFLSKQVTCTKNGRPDSSYTKWRWQPHHCNIPRFNSSEMVQKLHGKKVAFVGDSINRNQWESFICLVYMNLNSKEDLSYINNTDPHYKIFTITQPYNISVEFFWAPFFVHQDEMTIQNRTKRVLHLDQVVESSKRWKQADILVFNTGHWWSNKTKRWDMCEKDGKLYVENEADIAYEKALDTWANWVDNNIDTNKSMVFYRSESPNHLKSSQWNKHGSLRCYGETEPIRYDHQIVHQNSFITLNVIAEKVLKKIKKVKVQYLNITTMSEYRKDAHASVYTERRGKMITNEQRKQNPGKYADCGHWCLPGVPDSWNEILLALLDPNS